jgi:hypothetical protein
MAANVERQSNAARWLGVPPSPRYEMFRFEVEEIRGHDLFVVREYGTGHHIRYHECWSVGPRGGQKLRVRSGP